MKNQILLSGTSVKATTTFDYDYPGRVTDIVYGASVVSFDYSYVSNENNIYRKTFDHRSGDPYNEYSYDDLDRLTGVTYHDTDTEAFNMDDPGNRTGNQTLREERMRYSFDRIFCLPAVRFVIWNSD